MKLSPSTQASVNTATAIFIITVVTVSALLSSTGCSRKPKTHKEQVSYTIAAQFGRSLAAQKLDLDSKVLGAGIADGFKGENIQMTEAEMQAAMAKLTEDRQKEVKVESEKNKIKADEFLTKNKTAPGVRVTPSGLQYKILKEGSGPSPKGEDIVSVNYKGTLIDGSEFDSSYKRNMPAEFPLRGVIPGWTEGLTLMKKGGKATFYIPPELGYGANPRQQIPGNAVLIFDVELVDIKAPAAAKKK